MKIKQAKLLNVNAAILLTLVTGHSVVAEEKIIQQEKMSFEKCLQVIEISQNKLNIDPKINDVSNTNRVAVFELVDGELTITCDGDEELVTVTTKAN